MRTGLILILLFSTQSFGSANHSPIVNGQVASLQDHPWNVIVRIGSYRCGGVIISKKTILTARHCLLDGNSPIDAYKVTVLGGGDGRLPNVKKIGEVKFIKTYPDVEGDTADIGIIGMVDEIEFTSTTTQVFLPDPNYALNDIIFGNENEDFVLAGWGSSGDGNGPYGHDLLVTRKLRPLPLPTDVFWSNSSNLDRFFSAVEYRKTAFGRKSLFFSASDNSGGCYGDSGSGMVKRIEDKNVLIGLESAGGGTGCGVGADILVNVYAVLNWIKDYL